MTSALAPSHPHATRSPFLLDRSELDQLASNLISQARQRGASDAVARVSESDQLLVHVRESRPETLERSHRQGVSLTIYNGARRGSARTSDLSTEALSATLEAAWHIARHTGEDSFASPADVDLSDAPSLELDLFHPQPLTSEEVVEQARRAEAAARAYGSSIVNSNGARFNAFHGQFSLATSRGFVGGYAHSSHSLGCSVIAGNADGMQDGDWGMSRRRYSDLDAPEVIGRIAATRAHAKLNARPLKTGPWPVLFEASIAASLIGSLVNAVSGPSLYLGRTFLANSLGKSVLAQHLSLHESPHELRGLASAPFDDDGVRTCSRDVVLAGVLQSYFLSTYAARKLGMTSTGHAGGVHNLQLMSTRTRPDDDFAAMVRRLGRGLVVTGFMGEGINPVTGDYSRGVSGFWVEDGEIQHAVQGVTVAGNLKDILHGIVAIGADVHRAAINTGSILVDQLLVAGR